MASPVGREHRAPGAVRARGAAQTRRTLRGLAAAGLAAAFSLPSARAGLAQGMEQNLWVTNGQVNAVVPAGGRIYIGGAFTQVGPATGGGVPLDVGTGWVPGSFPKVTGTVLGVAPDGAGGWYIGGQFIAVGGLLRSNLAHVASDLSVTTWNPGADGDVNALAVSGSTVYVGGLFTNVGGQSRNRIAALDATTGMPTPWDPSADWQVLALAVRGRLVYAAGGFLNVGGASRKCIAALDATTGLASAWDPGANEGSVNALALSGAFVYAGGSFSSIGGRARNRIAALDTTTGVADADWNPRANGTVNALAVKETFVYAAGAFDSIGGQARNRIAMLTVAGGSATPWNPNANNGVWALALQGSTVYAAGAFTTIGAQHRNYIAAIDSATGEATPWNPNANKQANAIAVNGSTVYAGGSFTSVDGQARNNIAALDAASGFVAAWNPNANGSIVAMAASGSTVYVGGYFTEAGGQTRHYIAALDATSGLATSWNPDANSGINAFALRDSVVYVGGAFMHIGGQDRNRIAALSARTGLATAWNPNADSFVRALALSDAVVYAGGSFTDIGGAARNRIAALDATTGLATTWNPNAGSSVYALAVSGDRVYAGGDFITMRAWSRSFIAAIAAATGNLLADWNPAANGSVRALAVRGATVYAGGNFTTIGGQARARIAALDDATGTATPWNPIADDAVLALAVSGPTVYAGGSFAAIGNLPQSYIAGIAVAPELVSVQPASGSDTEPATLTVFGRYLRAGATATLFLGEQVIDGTGVAVAPDGLSLTATFDVRGRVHDAWHVAVTNPDLQSATLPGGFTVEALEAPQPRVDVVGPALIRGSHRTAFDLVIENQGNVTALAVPLWLAGVPADATIDLDFPLSPPPGDPGEPDWSTVPLSFPSAGGRYLALVIPRIPPGTISRRVYLTVPPSTPPFQLRAAVTPPWVGGTVLRSCLSDGGVIHNSPCVGSRLAAINGWLTVNPGIAALSGIGLWAKIAWQCEGATTLPDAVAGAEQALGFMARPVEQQGTLPPSCGDALLPRWLDTLTVTVVTSIDPNDKLGPHGTLSGQQALPYSVRFENLATATAPAQQVVVVDPLGLATLDVNTVSLDAITFGEVRLVPPPGLSSYSTEVDLRPATNLLVRVSAMLDRFTGVLTWFFTSIDPATGQPPVNPLAGFLPPNVTPPEGEGSVLFTVRPRSGLGSGTEIRNQAAITFDVPPAVLTPEWSNLLDTAPPASQVLALGANQDSTTFTVRWETSAPPDLRDFTVYVAEDGGAYRAWRQSTVATADTFASVPGGHRYRFYSVARDQSGNIEAAPGTPDAETYSTTAAGEPGPWRLALAGARPNPAPGAIHAHFTLPSAESATLELLDVAGRRVLRREVGSLGPGRHALALGSAPRLRPGLYFLRLAQGGRVLTARVAVIR